MQELSNTTYMCTDFCDKHCRVTISKLLKEFLVVSEALHGTPQGHRLKFSIQGEFDLIQSTTFAPPRFMSHYYLVRNYLAVWYLRS